MPKPTEKAAEALEVAAEVVEVAAEAAEVAAEAAAEVATESDDENAETVAAVIELAREVGETANELEHVTDDVEKQREEMGWLKTRVQELEEVTSRTSQELAETRAQMDSLTRPLPQESQVIEQVMQEPAEVAEVPEAQTPRTESVQTESPPESAAESLAEVLQKPVAVLPLRLL